MRCTTLFHCSYLNERFFFCRIIRLYIVFHISVLRLYKNSPTILLYHIKKYINRLDFLFFKMYSSCSKSFNLSRKGGLMRKINKDILFLTGIIVLCFGFLLFHINPYYAEPYATLKERINLFFWQLYWRPIGTLSILSGCIMTFKGLKK